MCKTATHTVRARFIYGERGHVPSMMLLFPAAGAPSGGELYRFIVDARGSVRQVVRVSDGVVEQRIEYGPFGGVLADSNSGFQPFGFAGGLFDAETGLVRFGARDYDSSIGRWLAKDPIGFTGGLSNLYSHAKSSKPEGSILLIGSESA
ncbi:MAG: RHS repeat-associated core domain-containing protein [Myxococcota bacterium]